MWSSQVNHYNQPPQMVIPGGENVQLTQYANSLCPSLLEGQLLYQHLLEELEVLPTLYPDKKHQHKRQQHKAEKVKKILLH